MSLKNEARGESQGQPLSLGEAKVKDGLRRSRIELESYAAKETWEA